MKKRFYFISILILGVLTIANIYSTAQYLLGSPAPTAKVRLKVVDVLTRLPVSGACVCIPEGEIYACTDDRGNTPLIEVPVIADHTFDNIYKRNFGLITVIVYKENYVDHIMMNITVRENEVRQGITVALFPRQESSPPFVSIVETPDENWVKELIDKYRKK
jgi:hypothetical protein